MEAAEHRKGGEAGCPQCSKLSKLHRQNEQLSTCLDKNKK